jgi:hypothetical protein
MLNIYSQLSDSAISYRIFSRFHPANREQIAERFEQTYRPSATCVPAQLAADTPQLNLKR